MRLLELDSGDTPQFSKDFTNDIPFYAILSHTWGADEDEVTFDDIRSGSGKQKPGYKKIQFCGQQARRNGLRYFWVDTCCINKPDYTELAEAITSMFRWYREAVKCYVYLSDVSIHDEDNDSPTDRPWEAAFRKSRWFTRGWTLQELLAPKSVDFFSREGKPLGDRSLLEQVIHEITDIPVPALQGVPVSYFSNDEKMRWAARRHTKKIEDRAYCLLGIFNVFMYLNYGEGDNAFSRLQLEITKSDKDESVRPIWHVPFERISEFIGRENEIQKVKQKLFETNGRRVVSILGLGGVGKSRFALELASQVRADYSQYSVFWVEATEQLTFEKDILEIGKRLQISGIEEEKADIKTLVKQRLSNSSGSKWILILDNADDESLWGKPSESQQGFSLVDYLPKTANGAILVTTRTRRVASFLAGKEVVELHALTESQAVEMFMERLEATEQVANRAVVLSLVQLMTYLPLAIVQAASFINMTQQPVETYLELLEEPEVEVIKLLSEDFGDESRYPNAKNPVATTWLISFEHIHRYHPLAARLLSCLACFRETNVPSSLLPEDGSKLDLIKAISILKGHSFITARAAGSDFVPFHELYDMHRLVRLAVRSWLRRDGSFPVWNEACIKRMVQIFPDSTYTNRTLWRAYIPHAQGLYEDSVVEDLLERYELLEKMGICFYEDGKYHDAVKMHSIVAQWRESTFGNTARPTLKAYFYLGEALYEKGDCNLAEKYLQQAYIGQMEILGQEDLETLYTMSDLANTFQDLGRLQEAEELEAQVLETSKIVLGSEHPHTLNSMTNLGTIFWKQGRFKEAEELETEALEIEKRVLGAEHPDTLISMDNLAWTLKDQNRDEEAIELMTSCLRLRREVLGSAHRDTQLAEEFLKEWSSSTDSSEDH